MEFGLFFLLLVSGVGVRYLEFNCRVPDWIDWIGLRLYVGLLLSLLFFMWGSLINPVDRWCVFGVAGVFTLHYFFLRLLDYCLLYSLRWITLVSAGIDFLEKFSLFVLCIFLPFWLKEKGVIPRGGFEVAGIVGITISIVILTLLGFKEEIDAEKWVEKLK